MKKDREELHHITLFPYYILQSNHNSVKYILPQTGDCNIFYVKFLKHELFYTSSFFLFKYNKKYLVKY